ncbi:MAG: hypothetical protein UV33_C0004G0002 [Candidatus Daviesbacteria bacterium GW2011_GWA1_42_6]|uniref:Uncharacterized protein n=1 Tax=Candidatus Daviesbacteria bacterium GW2011_GWA1_42_6 TaxID=1618420 RepID=A0A0G1AWP9_9BACT|nr:MAG: hypothetical protein UV33_C0004G0002 [Candidatus Daviesbacteria bacterium GW2011_GWA1_42_6]
MVGCANQKCGVEIYIRDRGCHITRDKISISSCNPFLCKTYKVRVYIKTVINIRVYIFPKLPGAARQVKYITLAVVAKHLPGYFPELTIKDSLDRVK